MIEAQRSRLL